jgi:hypothetical protein
MEAAGSLAHAWKQRVAGPLEWQRTGPQAGAASPPSFRHSKVVEWSDRASSSTLPGTCMLGDLDCRAYPLCITSTHRRMVKIVSKGKRPSPLPRVGRVLFQGRQVPLLEPVRRAARQRCNQCVRVSERQGKTVSGRQARKPSLLSPPACCHSRAHDGGVPLPPPPSIPRPLAAQTIRKGWLFTACCHNLAAWRYERARERGTAPAGLGAVPA